MKARIKKPGVGAIDPKEPKRKGKRIRPRSGGRAYSRKKDYSFAISQNPAAHSNPPNKAAKYKSRSAKILNHANQLGGPVLSYPGMREQLLKKKKR